jgi:hypothetical protein
VERNVDRLGESGEEIPVAFRALDFGLGNAVTEDDLSELLQALAELLPRFPRE